MSSVIKNNGYGANLRQKPAGTLIEALADGTSVVELATPTVDAKLSNTPYTWQAIRLADSTIGWVANRFLADAAPPPPLSTTRPGLHSLLDGRSKVQAFVAAGAKLGAMVIIGDVGYANDMAQTVPYVIYRQAAPANPVIPDDPALAEVYGHQFVRSAFAADNELGDVNLQVYMELWVESKWTPGHGGFNLGVAKELTSMGRRAALFAYAVGQPEVAEWLTLTDALRFAMANQHIAVLHAYCQPGTPAGQMSVDSLDYELRFTRLYAAAPADCRPALVISEFAGEFKTGQFQGAAAMVSLMKAYLAATAQYSYLKAVCQWTAGAESGQWAGSSVDSALTDPAVLALYRGYL